MDTVTAQPNTSVHGEEDEHHEKKPVLKKVMDKVKKIKKAINKKSPRHGNAGEDHDQHQHENDEEDDEFEESEEIDQDQAVHGVPTAGVGGEATKGVDDGLSYTGKEFDENQAKHRADSEADAGIGQNRDWNIGEGGEGNRGGERLITEKFVGDLTPPGTESETNTGIEHSRGYDSPALGVRATANEISEGEGRGFDRVSDGLGSISEDFVDDPAARKPEQSRVYESADTGARTGANDLYGGESAKRFDDGLGLITNDSVNDPAAARTGDETYTGIEQSRVHLSPTSAARTGVNEIAGESEAAVPEVVGEASGLVPMELVEDPSAPVTEAGSNTRTEQIQGGEEVEISPELYHSLDAMADSTQNDGGETKLPEDHSSSYTGLVSSAASKVYGTVADAGKAVISKVRPDTRKENDDDEVVEKPGGEEVDKSPELSRSMEAMTLSSPNDRGETELPKDQNRSYAGMVSSAASKVYGVVADAGTAVISKVKPGARTEGEDEAVGKQGGEEFDKSPELSRSLEAITISSPNDKEETELPKDQNKSYTGMVSSAASKVYDVVADAGSAVISKVKPDARTDGEDESVGKQGKGVSFKEYIAEKLTPGEDEKTLSELIREAGQKKRENEVVETPLPEKPSSDDGAKGVGVVERIKGTVTSFLGGGESSPKSPATEAGRKVAEDDADEAFRHDRTSSEELPPSYH